MRRKVPIPRLTTRECHGARAISARQRIAPRANRKPQRFGRARRENKRRRALCCRATQRPRMGRAAQNGGRIGAPKTEGIHTHHRIIGNRDGLRRARDMQVQIREINRWIGRCEMQRARHKALFQHEHGFEQAGHAGARFQMADIGLGRADRQRRAAMLRNGLPDRPGFSRVASLGAGAMRFKGKEIIRIHSAFFNQAFQQRGLRVSIGQ